MAPEKSAASWNAWSDAIARGVDLDTIIPRIKTLEKERDDTKAALAQIAQSSEVVSLHPAALDRFRHNVGTIHAALTGGLEGEEMAPFRAAFGTYLSGSWFMKPPAGSGMK